MISLEHHGNGFLVKVSDPGFGRYSVQARDLAEAIQAIRHYYGKPYHASPKAKCPLCRSYPEKLLTKRLARAGSTLTHLLVALSAAAVATYTILAGLH